MANVERSLLVDALRQHWNAETSYEPSEWNPNNPARGQCAVSSLIVQDYLGGEIQRAKAIFQGKRESHFYNVLPNGDIMDTTREQYPHTITLEEAPVTLGHYTSVREKLLDGVDNARKYTLLKALVRQALDSYGIDTLH